MINKFICYIKGHTYTDIKIKFYDEKKEKIELSVIKCKICKHIDIFWE